MAKSTVLAKAFSIAVLVSTSTVKQQQSTTTKRSKMFFTHKLTIGSTFKAPFHTIEKVNDIGDTVPVDTAWISVKLLNVEVLHTCEVTHRVTSTFTLEVDGKDVEIDGQTLFSTLFEHAYFGAETALELNWQGIRESEKEDEWLLFDHDEPGSSILLN